MEEVSRKWESRKSESEGRREIVKSYELMVESFGFQVSGFWLGDVGRKSKVESRKGRGDGG